MTDPIPLTTVVRHPLRMRVLEVEAVERPTPRLVRITLGGDGMEGFCCDGPADHVKLFFPAEGERRPALPELGEQGLVVTPGRPVVRGRDYTPKFDRLAEGRLVIDLVLHADGLGSGWARRAQVGDALGVAGPRGSHVLNGDFDGFVLVGDETALPAIQNFLRVAHGGQRVVVVIEVASEADRQPLGSDGALEVVWVYRRDNVQTAALLVEALSQLDLPSGRVMHWAAGEVGAVQGVRRHLIDDRGIDASLIETRGYWKHGTEDHQEAHED